MKNKYSNLVPHLDLLVISHPDKDHFDDLDTLLKEFGDPRVLHRNRSVPADVKYGGGQAGYQQAFRRLDTTYTNPVDWARDPMNPDVNGGVTVKSAMLDWSDASTCNNSSIVVAYFYAGTLLVLPGRLS